MKLVYYKVVQLLLLLFLGLGLIYVTPAYQTITGDPTITSRIETIRIENRRLGEEIQRNTFTLDVEIWNKSPTTRTIYAEDNPVDFEYTAADPNLTYQLVDNDTSPFEKTIEPGTTSFTISITVEFSQLVFGGQPPQGEYTFGIDLCLTREIATEILCFGKIDVEPLSVFYTGADTIENSTEPPGWGEVNIQITIHTVYVFVISVLSLIRIMSLVKMLQTRQDELYPNN